MAARRFKVSAKMLFTWFFLAGLIMLFAPQKLTGKLQGAFAHLMRAPLQAGRNIELFNRAETDLKGFVSREKYNQLQNHVANLEALLEEEKEKLRLLTGIQTRFEFAVTKLTAADIITTAVNPMQGQMMINRGSDDGVTQGQFVLASNSVIGRVTGVWAKTAQVTLATDPLSQLPVKIGDLNVNVLMRGAGNNTAVIDLLKIDYPVKKGDPVYARKSPAYLEAPIIVGRIESCHRDEQNPLLWSITVKPVCEIEELATVAVVRISEQ